MLVLVLARGVPLDRVGVREVSRRGVDSRKGSTSHRGLWYCTDGGREGQAVAIPLRAERSLARDGVRAGE